MGLSQIITDAALALVEDFTVPETVPEKSRKRKKVPYLLLKMELTKTWDWYKWNWDSQ